MQRALTSQTVLQYHHLLVKVKPQCSLILPLDGSIAGTSA